MDNLKNAIDNKNLLKISETAHSIKGASANIKFDKLAEIAKIIEESARKEKEIDYTNEFSQMQKLLEKYREIIG